MRGFAPGGIGPRDISYPGNIEAAGLGGTTYFGASAEVQFPIFGLPKEIGLKGALFADAGNLFGYTGPTNFSNFLGLHLLRRRSPQRLPITQLSCANVVDPNADPRFGRREPDLGVADRADPLRLRDPGHQGQV